MNSLVCHKLYFDCLLLGLYSQLCTDLTLNSPLFVQVMMPPSVKMELQFLVLTVHEAKHLPSMDKDFGVFSSAGIDAYVKCSFAGNPPARTTVKKLSKSKEEEEEDGLSGDADNTGLGPIWGQELWIPVHAMHGGVCACVRVCYICALYPTTSGDCCPRSTVLAPACWFLFLHAASCLASRVCLVA